MHELYQKLSDKLIRQLTGLGAGENSIILEV